MARRVIFQSGAASPLRISVAGSDAASAQFNQLIFDGNQPPLRLWSTGWIAVVPLAFANTAQVLFQDGPTLPVTPSGTVPIFFTVTRQQELFVGGGGGLTSPINEPANRTYDAHGMAAAEFDVGGSNAFTALNFNRDNSVGGVYGTNTGSPVSGVVNYAIMLNAT